MDSIRAYNMNLKELIQPEPKQNLISEQAVISGKPLKRLKADNDINPVNRPANDSSVKIDISPIWRKVASNIDLKNATSSEVAKLSADLFNAGAISFEDHINLSFQKDPGNDEKFDVIAYWQHQQEDAIHHGAVHEELNDIIRIQSLLGYVDSLRS